MCILLGLLLSARLGGNGLQHARTKRSLDNTIKPIHLLPPPVVEIQGGRAPTPCLHRVGPHQETASFFLTAEGRTLPQVVTSKLEFATCSATLVDVLL